MIPNYAKIYKCLMSSVKLKNIKVTHITRGPGKSGWQQPSWLGQLTLRTSLRYRACTENL